MSDSPAFRDKYQKTEVMFNLAATIAAPAIHAVMMSAVTAEDYMISQIVERSIRVAEMMVAPVPIAPPE